MLHRRRGSIPLGLALCAGLLMVSAAAGQTIWYVDAANCPGPGDGSADNPFCEIQPAINAAAANATPPDEIEVADGVYTGAGNKNLDFGGKIIKLRSASDDPSACIIDCEGDGRGFYFHSGETAEAEVRGFTIRNGYVTSSSPSSAKGGGVLCSSSSPTLIRCAISGNAAISTSSSGAYGGGVYYTSSNSTFLDCTIRGNWASVEAGVISNGGGVYCTSSILTMTGCTISGNKAQQLGGGLYFSSSSGSTLTDCTIVGNTVWCDTYSPRGGGVYTTSSGLTLTRCAIHENVAWTSSIQKAYGGGLCGTDVSMLDCSIWGNVARVGGGVYLGSSGSSTLINCMISGNVAASFSSSNGAAGGVYIGNGAVLTDCVIRRNTAYAGAGVYCVGTTGPTLNTCVITENSLSSGAAAAAGGGVLCASSGTSVINCTIAGNSGYGLSDYSSTSLAVTNCTVSGNTGGGLYCSSSATPTVTNCTISGNTGVGVYCYAASSSPTLTNCILWGDTPQEISGGTPVVTYCDVQGGYTGAGNIDVNPGFALTDDYHLTAGSPCVDAGTDTPSGGLTPEDADGSPRPLDGNGDGSAVTDMGAYEFNPAAPSIAVSPARIAFTVPAGQAGPLSQALSIRNAGSGTLSWTLDWDASWLQADPLQGESTGEVDAVTLHAYAGSLTRGIYSATLTIVDSQASNSPRRVEVLMYAVGSLHVPAEYDTIQSALGAAIPEDEVLVADGVYTGIGNKNLDFFGKAIALRSASGDPTACIIDCAGNGRGFLFHCGETSATVLDGFTVRNGLATDDSPFGALGGGVFCHASNPTIAACIISGNATSSASGTSQGGGVFCWSASPVLTNCTISGNTISCTGSSVFSGGAGLGCYYAGPVMSSCTISANAASPPAEFVGGGVYSYHSSITMTDCSVIGNMVGGGGGICFEDDSSPTDSRLTNCTISGNAASSASSAFQGGGVSCVGSSPALTNCTISGNTAGSGGGVSCDESSPALTDCTISGNTATGAVLSHGGGVFCSSFSSPTLTNCMIRGNRAFHWGGGVFCESSSNATLTNCTISGNRALSGGGLRGSFSSPKLTNCILWGNAPQEIWGGTPVVTYCDVQGGYAGTGNINVDPLFALPADFYLAQGSPCIDTGTNNPVGGLPAQDADGNPRPLDGDGDGQAVADMGAYEFNPNAPTIALSSTRITFFVPEGQAGQTPQTLSIRNAGGGTLSWTLAWSDSWLQADPWQGESTGEEDTVSLTADASSLTHGTYSTTLEVADPAATNSPRFVEVVLHVVLVLHVPSAYATIQAALDAAVPGDEIVVADGTYTGAGNKDLDFRGNPVTLRSANGNPTTCIIDCEENGRGFYFHTYETAATVVNGFTIRNGSEHGVSCSYSSPTVTHCVISGNAGGGVLCDSRSDPMLINCTITGNTATGSTDGYGGGVRCNNLSNPTLINCTIAGNTATSGGGVYCRSSSSPTLSNCILWRDTPQEIYVSSGTPLVTYCDIQGGYAGTGNIDLDPQFVDPDGPDDDPATWQDNDYRLAAGSPCIDAGLNSAVPADALDLDGDGDTNEPIPFDLDGLPRFVDDPAAADCPYVPDTCGEAPIVDMGAYEYQPSVLPGDLNCDGVVDVDDVAPFALALVDSTAYQATYPGCDWLRADLDASGAADGSDVQLFVAVLVEP